MEWLINFLKRFVGTKRKPDIPLLQMPSAEAKAEVEGELQLKLLYPTLMDYFQPYYYTTAEGWAEVFNYIYLVFDMPKYIVARMDCEDFAMLLKGLVSALFGLNYFALVLGDTPMGFHGFNLFRTEDGFLLLEPQTAEFFELGEKGYKPKYALL